MMIRTPYPETSINDMFKPMYQAQFENDYVVIVQNERGTEWSEGDFGFLTKTTSDAQDTLDWVSAQDWSNGKVGLHGCSSTAENQLRLGAIGHPALTACVPMSSGSAIGDVPGVDGLPGQLLSRRRADAEDLGAVARTLRRAAPAEAAGRGRGRRAGPHLPSVLGQRARLPGARVRQRAG